MRNHRPFGKSKALTGTAAGDRSPDGGRVPPDREDGALGSGCANTRQACRRARPGRRAEPPASNPTDHQGSPRTTVSVSSAAQSAARVLIDRADPATWPRSTCQSFDRLIQDRRSGEKSWRSPEHSRHGITATSPWAAALSLGSLSIPNPLIANWSALAACHLEGTPGCPTRRRNYPGPASVFLSSAHRHTVFDPVRRDDPVG
jgi:hypothetical protein